MMMMSRFRFSLICCIISLYHMTEYFVNLMILLNEFILSFSGTISTY